jgi:hypothetical protein
MQVVTTKASKSTESFQWKIEGWSLLPAKQGEATKSLATKYAGHEWCLSVYPGGQPEGADDTDAIKALKKSHVGLFLCFSGPEDVKTKHSLSIVNQLPNKPNKNLECHTS